jgi:DNA-binding transcriptional MerR regulator
MVTRGIRVFTTEKVTELVGLDVKKDKWRVIKFAQSKEYGISPSMSQAAGSGSRRLYDLENVCEIALALRLLETGLRSMAIGKVIRQLSKKGPLHKRLAASNEKAEDLLIAIVRTPETGKPLDVGRDQIVEWVSGIEEAEQIRSKGSDRDLILVPVGSYLGELNRRLQQLELAERRRPDGN